MPSHSVPTSPAMARSTSHKGQPVTPQRLPAQRLQHRYSSSHSFYKSPATPASPYTPLSLRSFTSSGSGGSSTLTTPDHVGSGIKLLSFSPDVIRLATEAGAKDQSLADIAENWRSRASENGIKVSSLNDDSHFGDDEASDRTFSDSANDSGFISTEEALLAPSLIPNQRRSSVPLTRPRAQSHVPTTTFRGFASPTHSRKSARTLAQPASPLISRRLNQSQNHNLMSTPPPNRALAKQFKLKGSLTDPAHTRRREALGPLRTPGHNMNKTFSLGLNQETSLDLFDIDENDFENDYNHDPDQEVNDDSLMELGLHSKHSISNNTISTYGYPNYNIPLLPSYGQQQQFYSSHSQAPFSDPYHHNALSNITENVEHYFHSQRFEDNQIHGLEQSKYRQYPRSQPWIAEPSTANTGPGLGAQDGYMASPVWVPAPTPSIVSLKPSESTKPAELKKNTTSGCSVCLAASLRTLAFLIPCGHPLCSACLTSALNIVGEKDMECAVCRCKVADFKLVTGDHSNTEVPRAEPRKSQVEKRGNQEFGRVTPEDKPMSFMDSLISSPESRLSRAESLNTLESAFEFGLGLESVRASTPKRDGKKDSEVRQPDMATPEGESIRASRERGRGKGKSEENIVLRIDNVPWDITPPQIHKWLQQPLERVHVLLDKRGKTMSHAYVEVADVAIAGKILRGEAQGEQYGGKQRERGSVLGKGRRARGVTVTRSGQEELMTDLFPSWRGSFDGSRPSLARLGSERVIGALEGGLIGENEVIGLLHLIKEPDSHFLKAPSLPFHSLISVLSKFPVDVDSRVFWSSGVRDMLYDVAYASVQILLARVNSTPKSSDNEYSMELVSDLVKTALGCHAFTAQQLSKFTDFLEKCSVPLATMQSTTPVEARSYSEPRTPNNATIGGFTSTVPPVVEDEVPGSSYVLPSVERNTNNKDDETLADLAKEFGVEAQLVHALAQRLAGLC